MSGNIALILIWKLPCRSLPSAPFGASPCPGTEQSPLPLHLGALCSPCFGSAALEITPQQGPFLIESFQQEVSVGFGFGPGFGSTLG